MLAAGTAPGAVFDLLRQPAPYLRLCTHGEVIAQVLPLLADEGLAIDDPLRWPKGPYGSWSGREHAPFGPATYPRSLWAPGLMTR